jgi:HEAT repeat protein
MKAKDAVPPLIEAARGKDATFEREVVFALGEIGGDEAEAYLFTLAQGHDDPIVRASAERALEDLKQKRTMKARPGDSP